MNAMQVGYVNVYVTDLERAVRFYGESLGLPLQYTDAEHGYASVDAGPVRIGLACIDPSDAKLRDLAGRQTGVGLGVPDLEKAHRELASRGVSFTMEPSRQPWGGFMAMFADPDGNVFYLDEMREHH